jgi:hypothetical protein
VETACSTNGQNDNTDFWLEYLKKETAWKTCAQFPSNLSTTLGTNTKMGFQETLYGLDSSGSGLGPAFGSCEEGNEASGSVKCGDILYLVSVLPIRFVY